MEYMGDRLIKATLMKWNFLQYKKNHHVYLLQEVVVPDHPYRLDLIGFNNNSVVAYEIKSSYDDFIRDKKWEKYIDFVDYFSIITPHTVDISCEIPDNVGYIQIDFTTDRFIFHSIRTIKKGVKNKNPLITSCQWREYLSSVSARRCVDFMVGNLKDQILELNPNINY